jgi:uncharacterized protein DUF2612
MLPERITDHVTSGLDRLIDRYREVPELRGWITAYLNRIQEAETLVWQIFDARMLDNAVGVQLDILGRIVGQVRISDDDDEYRLAIRARIRINISQGGVEDLIELGRLLFGDAAFDVFEVWPSQVRIEYLEDASALPVELVTNLFDQARAATIDLRFESSTQSVAESFTFGNGTEESTTLGFDHDATDTTGGKLISVRLPSGSSYN